MAPDDHNIQPPVVGCDGDIGLWRAPSGFVQQIEVASNPSVRADGRSALLDSTFVASHDLSLLEREVVLVVYETFHYVVIPS